MKVARFVLGVCSLVVATAPVAVFAGTTMPSRIVPCDGAGVGGGTACTCSHIVTLIQNLINTGIIIVVVLSALMFAFAGFLYVTNQANPTQVDKARTIFQNVAIGLFIMLGAWLVVDTLMKSVLGGDFGPWNAIQPVEEICRKLGIS